MEFNNYKEYRTVRQINAVIYLTDYEVRLADLRKKKNIVTINLFGREVIGKRYGKNGDEFIEIRDRKNLKKI